MAVEEERKQGYMERSFRARASVAEGEKVKGQKLAGFLSRKVKDLKREEFKQQKTEEVAKVKHIGRIVQHTPRGRTFGVGGVAGVSGTSGVRASGGKPKSSRTGQDEHEEEISKQGRTLTAGGMMTIEKGKRWTTAGMKEKGPSPESYYEAQSVGRAKMAPGRSYGASGLKNRQLAQRQQVWQKQRDDLVKHYASKGERGKKAVEKLTKEWEQRQKSLYASFGIGKMLAKVQSTTGVKIGR